MNIEDINRHWLVWLHKDFDTALQEDSIQKHINNDLPFVCARFTPNQMNRLNLGYCGISETVTKKPRRYSIQAGSKDIDKIHPPLLVSEVVVNIPKLFSDKLNQLLKWLTDAELPEPCVFGSYLWQSISGEAHIRKESDLDLIVYTDSLVDMCLYADIFNRWELQFNTKIDCEFCVENNIFFSSKEFFNPAEQLIIKTKNSVDLVCKKVLLDKIYKKNSYKPAAESKHYSSEQLALCACKSLYSELAAYPKPGLVSFHDSGSHNDMDHTTFIKSIRTLYSYFKNIANAVMNNCSFQDMVNIGKEAESKMFNVTNNINTHKGAIFSLGLIVAATAKCMKQNIRLTPGSIQQTLLNNWKKDIINHSVPDTTHGRKAVNNYNANGILIEAARGFPIVFETALPCLQNTLKKTKNWNSSLIQAFFTILSILDDTNLLHRGGKDALISAKQEALSFLDNEGALNQNWYNDAERIHQSFIERKLSPGGCADILACTVFLSYLNN